MAVICTSIDVGSKVHCRDCQHYKKNAYGEWACMAVPNAKREVSFKPRKENKSNNKEETSTQYNLAQTAKVVLYWIEPHKSWEGRGYANNLVLAVNFAKGTYMYYKTYSVPGSEYNTYYVEAKRKSDIEEYEKFLRNGGMKKVKD